jgi:hypothetical protein
MAAAGDTVYPTISQLSGLGVWVSHDVTGLDFPDGYEHQLLPTGAIGLSITPESAEALGHTVTDLSLELQVPPVNATDCKSTHTFAGLSCYHRDNVGIYGPHPAHDHTDWVPGGGAEAPAVDGTFTVTGTNGTLTLTIASGYEQRLGQAAAQDFPPGMPGVPQIYWYHKADVFASYSGSPGNSTGAIWTTPWEGVYCWRGWGSLITQFDYPAVGAGLTLTITGKRFTFSDNHVVGSTRQQEFTYTTTPFSHTYTAREGYAAGTATHTWCIVNPDTAAQADLEMVETIQIGGLVPGEWKIYEPKLQVWADEPLPAEDCMIKVFEAPAAAGDQEHSGGSYRKGGFSAHVYPAYDYCLYWGDEWNANVEEKTGGMFDCTLSPNYMIDATTAFSLTALEDLITNCCDAWSCGEGTGYIAATTDADLNQLSTWAFDVVPVLQGTADGVLTCALRCGQWTIDRGIECKVVTDKWVQGNFHGLAASAALGLETGGDYARIYQQNPTTYEWTVVQDDVQAIPIGHWHSLPQQECQTGSDGSDDFIVYGVGLHESTEPLSPTARLPVREYVSWLGIATLVGGEDALEMMRHPLGSVIWSVWIAKGKIMCAETFAGRTTLGTVHTVDSSGSYDAVGMATDSNVLYIDARNSTSQAIYRWTSEDYGETWAGPVLIWSG